MAKHLKFADKFQAKAALHAEMLRGKSVDALYPKDAKFDDEGGVELPDEALEKSARFSGMLSDKRDLAVDIPCIRNSIALSASPIKQEYPAGKTSKRA
jgi:hypothetical protein